MSQARALCSREGAGRGAERKRMEGDWRDPWGFLHSEGLCSDSAHLWPHTRTPPPPVSSLCLPVIPSLPYAACLCAYVSLAISVHFVCLCLIFFFLFKALPLSCFCLFFFTFLPLFVSLSHSVSQPVPPQPLQPSPCGLRVSVPSLLPPHPAAPLGFSALASAARPSWAS